MFGWAVKSMPARPWRRWTLIAARPSTSMTSSTTRSNCSTSRQRSSGRRWQRAYGVTNSVTLDTFNTNFSAMLWSAGASEHHRHDLRAQPPIRTRRNRGSTGLQRSAPSTCRARAAQPHNRRASRYRAGAVSRNPSTAVRRMVIWGPASTASSSALVTERTALKRAQQVLVCPSRFTTPTEGPGRRG